MRGFTLAEVLMASTIGSFIALVAVGTLKAVVDGAQVVNRSSETTSELRFAARMLARDLANLYRDPNPENMRLMGASQAADATGPAFLTFYTVGRAKARADRPEGDVYEVEYLLGTRETDEASDQPETASQVLFRRLWPNPDKDRSPGGVVTPIAENIGAFQIQFFDGKQWGGEWTEEMKSLPKLMEITLVAAPQGRGEPVVETFMATFPRLAEGAEVPTGTEQAAPGEPEQAQPQQPGGEPGGGQNPPANEGNAGNAPRQSSRKR
jgi:type II secretion system protein J